MMSYLLVVTALLSQLQFGAGTSTESRPMTGRGSIAALNGLVVIGDPTAEDLTFSYYTYQVTSNALAVDDYVAAKNNGGALTLTPITLASGDMGYGKDKNENLFQGFGAAVAIADANTVFVSQTSASARTGRVIVYEGNVTSFTGKQLLIPYDGAHRQDSDAAFGEAIAAKHDAMAAGCQLCNTSSPVNSGAVYVYKPNKAGRWSENQVLTADGVNFMGERVAMHDKVLIASGDDATYTLYQHVVGNLPNLVVVYEEAPDGKFEQSQSLSTNKGSASRELISSIAVFDETIAVTTIGTDSTITGTATVPDKVYVYYPTSERFGFSSRRLSKGKPKPSQQWTNIQILTATGNLRYTGGNPMVSISHNDLWYMSTDTAGTPNNFYAKSTRQCLSCKFSDPASTTFTATNNFALLTADHNDFIGFAEADGILIGEPVGNTLNEGCLILSLQDQFNDGWGIANLVVERPDGAEDRFTLQCTTNNPNVFKYCPTTQRDGRYHMRIENGEETPYGWEIVWKVAAGGVWYYGDRHTHMDFLWDSKYNDFHAGASRGVLPLYDTCKICDPSGPVSKGKGKGRRLSNLRSLHHKGVTASPTVSAAPTIASSGGPDYWNQIRMIGAASSDVWFDSSYNGAYFWVTSADGKRLLHTGTSCSAVDTTNAICWLDIPDGDYKMRVGSSVDEATRSTDLTWKFCYAQNALKLDTELSFTVRDGECYAGALVKAEDKCLNTYKSSFYLKVGVILGGSSMSLSASDESTLSAAVMETLHSVLGSHPASARVASQTLGSSGLEVSLLVKFDSLSDSSALDSLVRETSSAGSLLKYELIGSQSLSSHFMHGEVDSVTLASVVVERDFDYSSVDESSFQTATDHLWVTSGTSSSSSSFNSNVEYVAEGAYAVVAVAAVLAVSLYVRRLVAKEENVGVAVKPSFSTEVGTASDDVETPQRVKLTSLPKRNFDVSDLKSLAGDEE